LDGGGGGVLGPGDGPVGGAGADADVHRPVDAVLPDGGVLVGDPGARQALDGAAGRLVDPADGDDGAGGAAGPAGCVAGRLVAGHGDGPGRGAGDAGGADVAVPAERGQRGGVFQLLRPGVLRAALVADDQPAPQRAFQLRADPGRGVLGGGAAPD